MLLLNTLSLEQKGIVEYNDNLLVIACPGSGKTRTLVAKLIYEGIKLKKNEKVAAITYTNLAAEEIALRLEANCIEDQFYWGGTIHSFCRNWIIKPFSHLVEELKYGYSLLDEDDVKEIKQGLGDINLNTRRNPNGDLVSVNEENDLILKEYDHKLKTERLVDYDLILYYAYKILRDKPSIAKNLSTIFRWILIDEYQDTQELQYLIIGQIIKAGRNKTKLLIVGDPNQGIYQTLGGISKTKEEIEDCIGGYPVNEKSLNGNYRSTQQIIDIYKNFQIFGDTIKAKGDNKDDTSYITFNREVSVENLAPFIRDIIVDLHENKGIPYKEIAVIAPQWSILIDVARAIKQLDPNLPLDAAGLSPLCRDDNNVFYHLSKLLLSSPAPDKIVLRMRWANNLLESLSEKIPQISDINLSLQKILKITNSFSSTSVIGIEYLKEGFTYFFNKLNIDISLHPNVTSEFNEFEKKCINKQKRNGLGDSISVYKNGFAESGGVTFISIHKCKGLEYDTVIGCCLLWGYLPYWDNIFSRETDGNEISKKLLYVLSSRAKNNLFLISETGRITRKGEPYNANHHLIEVFR
ncbi:UvrD-helicase domain-containing protein [Paenibacillus larvae]|uniref:DNA 3'-5' helicase n=1 Tax=Paenibacillus larvae subsp. larvae TaxID=147375 RepID=A0A2L1U7L5_9BACL|nr:ATP-dependent helicase [Paenibacillus larvae]AVF28911.1 ATP-dependent DNA helicase PcrA [Paenibacillus larvae subsp. larvae]MCY9502656.1 ATP-dependent helicase [Paenibacillus larvae]MDR5608802.1 ATP-dependent helicase [Paenibacillus larvae]